MQIQLNPTVAAPTPSRAWESCRYIQESCRLKDAEVLVMEKMKQVLGDDHPDTLTSMGNLAITYRPLEGCRAARGGDGDDEAGAGRR